MEEKFIVEGRKAFFIAPDITILPESYLEDFLVRGYETYIIDDFRFYPLEGKVDIIVGNFSQFDFVFFRGFGCGRGLGTLHRAPSK